MTNYCDNCLMGDLRHEPCGCQCHRANPTSEEETNGSN